MQPRRSLVLHDTVDEVVKRIPAHCRSLLQEPQDLIATRNALRLLATKAPVGNFGNQDREESRAVVLLEYVVRDRSVKDGTSTTFKLKDICKSVGMKESSFKKLHATIGHYYQDLTRQPTTKRSIPSVSSQVSAAKRRAPSSGGYSIAAAKNTTTANNNRNTNSRPSENAERKSRRGEMRDSILPSLAIRLAGHLADPNGVARRSRILFHEIYAHALSSLPTAAERRGQEHDFRRYSSAYQASVLFYVATNLQKDQPNASRKDEETAVRPLKLEDLVKASGSDCTYMVLKEKLACIEKWAQEIQPNDVPRSWRKREPKQKKSSTTTRIAGNEAKTTSVEMSVEKNEFDFATWKESILAPVLERTKLSVPEEKRGSLDRDSLVAMATNTILGKYGL